MTRASVTAPPWSRSSRHRRSSRVTSGTAPGSWPFGTRRRSSRWWSSPRSWRRSVVAAIFRRWPWSFPLATFAVLPLRVPVHVGGQTSHLLVPLYLVIAGGVLCFGYAALRGRSARGDGGPPAQPATLRDSTAVVWLYRVLAATLVLYAIQSAYSADVSNAIENASFFLVPFALLFVMLGEVRWTERLLGWVLVTVSAVALRVRGGRVLGVRGPRPAAQQGRSARLQPAAPLLPRQLAVLRPEHPGPGARARAGRARRLPGVDPEYEAGNRRRRRRGHPSGRPGPELLDHRVRRPDRRPTGRDGAPVGDPLGGRRGRRDRRQRRRSSSLRAASGGPI